MARIFFFAAAVFFLSAAIFYITVTRLDPFGEQAFVAFASFFLSVFCGVASFFSFCFFFFAEIFAQRKLGERHFLVALRRGLLVALLITVLLLLQLFRMLGVLEVGLLVIFLALVEYMFLEERGGKL